jgi:hypothetical protein
MKREKLVRLHTQLYRSEDCMNREPESGTELETSAGTGHPNVRKRSLWIESEDNVIAWFLS